MGTPIVRRMNPFRIPNIPSAIFGEEVTVMYMEFMELRENISHGTKEYPFAQYHINQGAVYFPVHWHDEAEIIYIKEGTLRISISDQEYIGNAGSVFIVNPKELHYMSAPGMPILYYTLLFPLEFISFQTEDALEMDMMRPLRSGQLLLKNDLSAHGSIHDLMAILDELIQVNCRNDSGKQIKTRILLLRFLDILVSNYAFTVPSLSGKTEMQREILLYVQQNYCSRLSLQDLANHFYMSAKYLSRYFKLHFDLTFSQYIMHLRITHAKKLLETTALPITEIALCSGFSGVSYFIRSFKDHYGISPLQYRKQETAYPRLTGAQLAESRKFSIIS